MLCQKVFLMRLKPLLNTAQQSRKPMVMMGFMLVKQLVHGFGNMQSLFKRGPAEGLGLFAQPAEDPPKKVVQP